MAGANPAMATTLDLPDLAATGALGRDLAAGLRPRDVVALHGALGAGKTALARAIIRAASDAPDLAVPSPTFTLVEVYDTPRGAIWHFDLYRLTAADEVWELGFEEALAEGITLIEWPERLGSLLPADRLDVSLAAGSHDEARRATIEACGRATAPSPGVVP